MRPHLPRREFPMAKGVGAQNGSAASRPSGDPAVCGSDSTRLGPIFDTAWADLFAARTIRCACLRFHERTRQYRKKAIPTTKQKTKRRKNFGPIIAANKKQKRISFTPSMAAPGTHDTNLRFANVSVEVPNQFDSPECFTRSVVGEHDLESRASGSDRNIDCRSCANYTKRRPIWSRARPSICRRARL
jgi:hypothetical protein